MSRKHRVSHLVLASIVAASVAVMLCPASVRAQQRGEQARGPRLTKPPKLLRFVEAAFPESEKAAGKSASVVLQVAIAADGSVEQVMVLESAGAAFDGAAVEAVRRFVFEPAEIDGKPAGVKIVYRYEFTFKPEQKQDAAFSGVIRAQASAQPMTGVLIELGDGQRATSDAQGRFSFANVAPGKLSVSLSGQGLTPLRTEETFEAGKQLDAVYEIDAQKEPSAEGGEDEADLELVIVAPPLKKQVVSMEVSAEQGRRVPGTQGDVLKVVESMPGVGRASVGSGALVVWGAAPQDTRVYIDGVRVPLLYHNGGLRSVVHSDLVSGVELSPGGYGPAHGRGLGGLVQVRLRPLDEREVHGSVSVDLIDAAASVRAPIGEKLRFAVAVRRSHLDAVLSKATSRDVGAYTPIPQYADAQARLSYALSERETIEAGVMWSSDRIARNVVSEDPAERKRETSTVGFWRVFTRYQHSTPDGAEVNVVPSFGLDRTRKLSAFGATPAQLDVDAQIYGLRASWRKRTSAWAAVSVGLDAEVTRASLHRAGSVTTPAREGDVRVFGQPPSDQLNVDTWDVTAASAAPFAEVELTPFGEDFHVTPGVRIEPYFTGGSRKTPAIGDTPAVGYAREQTAIEPRLSIRHQLGASVALKAGWGLYHQAPLPEDLSAVFGSPSLGLSRAMHYLAGGAFKLSTLVSFETTVFFSNSQDLTVRSPRSSPLLAQALEGDGKGRAYGAQMMLRRELGSGFFGWISYTLLRSERTDGGAERWRLFDHDQTHVLTALGSLELGRGFELGARFRYATGLPRTPVIGAYYDSRRDQYSPVFGSQNSARVPAFYQFDVRGSKRMRLGAAGELELFVDVQNVTDHENAEEIVFSRDYKTRSYITGLPLLPVVGGRLSW